MPSPPPKRKTQLFMEPEDIRLLKAEAAASGLSTSDLVTVMLVRRIAERQAKFAQLRKHANRGR
jgi:hypothetical protein